MLRKIVVFLSVVFASVVGSCVSNAAVPVHFHYTVVVYDSSHGVPLQLARVALYRGKSLSAGKLSDINGRANFEDVEAGEYELRVFVVDYQPVSRIVTISLDHEQDTIKLQTVVQQEIVIGAEEQAPSIPTIDLKTGVQSLDATNYHASPTHQIINLIQENLLGAVRAPTGEVHIKGMHGEYTYYVDGVPVPLGVFGGLNSVVDDKVVDVATLLTGTIPAEYGGQVAAVINLQNRVPTGAAHLDFSTYAGSYLGRNNASPDSLQLNSPKLKPINVNGQNLSLSDHVGNLGIFLSGTRQETDRRIDEPLPYIYSNHGFDYFTYGKFDYILGENDYLTMNLNWSRTQTQVPYDPVQVATLNDLQTTTNSYEMFSYDHTISREADHESDFLFGVFARQGSLGYLPGQIDPHNFFFADDSVHGYVLNLDRSFSTYGFRTKFSKQFSHEVQFAAGVDLSIVSGTEHFTAVDTNGNTGRDNTTDYKGSNFGAFAQSTVHPAEWTSFDVGVRYDQQVSPVKPLESQWQPRFKWNVFLDEATTVYAYYGKIMVLNNLEGLRQITVAANVNADSTPTFAERDDYYETGLMHSFDFGLRLKADVFKRVSLPGVDDQTVGSSAIKTPVNIAEVRTTGIELGLSYSAQNIPLNGYVNASLIHAYGIGVVSGGFLQNLDDGAATDLDHDQRLSIVASVNYQPHDWFANVTAIYGSGLTNYNPNGTYQTGLFDFNQAVHTTPSWIVSASIGYTFRLVGGAELRPSLYVNNLFDNVHLLKGAYFSSASWEDPRNMVLKVEVHL
ncbi:MAG TPA: TonB-dependent receptor [Candidatus Kapabacteria bacterium]|nr:TonB-dependent receptor [Candidatus Kapabacteria bacterium]